MLWVVVAVANFLCVLLFMIFSLCVPFSLTELLFGRFILCRASGRARALTANEWISRIYTGCVCALCMFTFSVCACTLTERRERYSFGNIFTTIGQHELSTARSDTHVPIRYVPVPNTFSFVELPFASFSFYRSIRLENIFQIKKKTK